jgi:inner membrane protein involved in colicin E2 resistance
MTNANKSLMFAALIIILGAILGLLHSELDSYTLGGLAIIIALSAFMAGYYLSPKTKKSSKSR